MFTYFGVMGVFMLIGVIDVNFYWEERQPKPEILCVEEFDLCLPIKPIKKDIPSFLK